MKHKRKLEELFCFLVVVLSLIQVRPERRQAGCSLICTELTEYRHTAPQSVSPNDPPGDHGYICTQTPRNYRELKGKEALAEMLSVEITQLRQTLSTLCVCTRK